MEFHFSVEESLMRLLPYPDYHAHRAEHQRELQHISEIECRMLCQNLDHSLPLLMRHRLLGHIVVGDKLLAQYALNLFGQHASGKSKGGASTSWRRAAIISPND